MAVNGSTGPNSKGMEGMDEPDVKPTRRQFAADTHGGGGRIQENTGGGYMEKENGGRPIGIQGVEKPGKEGEVQGGDVQPKRRKNASAIRDIYERRDEILNEDDDSGKVGMKRRMTLLDGVAINVGIIVGSGIFVSPKGVLSGVGSVGMTLIVWVLCGLFSLVGALCYAELGTMIPASGGAYAYIRVIYGDFMSFLIMWTATVMAQPSAFAVIVLTFATYSLQPLYPYAECPPPRSVTILIAIACTSEFRDVNK